MQHSVGSFMGQQNITIFTQQWLPEGAPRAVIVIAHGYGEHSGRYAHVAAHLVQHRYAVYALDHRGHGQSGGPRTQIRDMREFVADLHTYIEQVRAAHPDLPLVLYGHSMGSQIALLYAGQHQDDLAGLITTGTALASSNHPLLVAAVKLLGGLHFNGRILPQIPASAISRDPDIVQAYVDDPLVDSRPVRLDMAAALARGLEHAGRVLPDLRVPYLALHGGGDLITLPEAARIVERRSGSPDTTVKIYDGLYHEIHNEPENDQVLADITQWLDEHVG